MNLLRTAILLGVLGSVLPRPALAQDAPTSDATTPAYQRACELQRQGKWGAAQRAFKKLLESSPESVHAEDARLRSDDNALLGSWKIHDGGPSERRIDVCVMGDGFTLDVADQNLQEKWADLCLSVLFSEKAFDEYRNYFNFFFVRLASLEEGVDPNLSPEERKKAEERNKRRTRKKKLDFSTALDCKAAGPQGQVMADPRLVRRWMTVAERDTPGCNSDGLAIAFARFGRLGMGGGGIANVGRPDKSVTVHEFGHAFCGLLDEYANNPGSPTRNIQAANASMTDDPKQVPWAHFLEKRVQGVGVYEGGATFRKGVWRPARSCAMNSAGATGFCPVCREQTLLSVYGTLSPIDTTTPAPENHLRLEPGSKQTLEVVPMRPLKHDIEVTWFVAPGEPPASSQDEGDEDEGSESNPRTTRYERIQRALRGRYIGGQRRREDRTIYETPPAGEMVRYARREKKDGEFVHVFPLEKLDKGTWHVTARAVDKTPWVLKDPKHLLEQRATWYVTIQ